MQVLRSFQVWIAGKKTYFVGLATIIYSLGIARHWWPSENDVWGILGATGAMTLRAAIAKFCVQVAGVNGSGAPGGRALPGPGEKLFGQ